MICAARASVLALVTLAGCGGGGGGGSSGPPPSLRTFTISGTISGGFGDHVQVALASSTIPNTISDAQGHYAFTGVPPGTYIVFPLLYPGGFTPSNATVTVVDRDVAVPPFASPSGIRVSGAIVGVVATDTVVTMTDGVTTRTAVADPASGGYEFLDVPGGHYTFSAASPYYTFVPSVPDSFIGRWGDVNFTGTANWHTVTTAGVGLGGIWGSGASDAWVVGGGGKIMHWDGASWSDVASDATESLAGVWGTGPADAWAVGTGGAIVHWDGSAWKRVPSGSTSPLASVSGSGPNDVWAVGGQRNLESVVLHWDGAAWSQAWSSNHGYLASVSARAPDDAWAVGGTYDAQQNLLGNWLHWDGTAWSESTFPTTSPLSTIWGAGPGDYWAVGGLFRCYHLEGPTWFDYSAILGNGETPFTIGGSSPTDVWMAGGDVRVNAVFGHVLTYWDGAVARIVSTGPTQGIVGIWGASSNDLWAIEAGGGILRFQR